MQTTLLFRAVGIGSGGLGTYVNNVDYQGYHMGYRG